MMRKINDFRESAISNSALSTIHGGAEISTSFENDENTKFTDIFYDNDNNGSWSAGDILAITKSAPIAK